LTAGLVVACAVDDTTAILGVAARTHTGSSSSINPNDYSLEIPVYYNPSQIFECEAPKITATGGTTTTIIATGDDAFADDAFNGGKAKLISKVAASTNTDPIGTIYSISDFDTSDETFTINTAGGAVTAGDIFYIFPPIGFATVELETNLQHFDLAGDDGTVFRFIGSDTTRNTVQFNIALHQLGNKNS
jgi:hypothetical protein